MANKIVSRASAIADGSKNYFTGKPCKHGHISERIVSNKNCRECYRLRDMVRYSKRKNTDKLKDRSKRNYLRYVAKNPEKAKAHQLLNHAVKQGNIKKQPCEKCGATYRIHGHHDDYSKPLDVVWLCAKHHIERHQQLKKSPSGLEERK